MTFSQIFNFFLVSTVFFINNNLSFAGIDSSQSCREVDLLSQTAPLHIWSESRIQNPFDWCGSFALADVLSYKIGEPVSGLQIGAIYHQNLNRQSQTRELPDSLNFSSFRKQPSYEDIDTGYGGRPCDLFKSVQENGACKYRAIEGQNITGKKFKEIASSQQNINLNKGFISASSKKCTHDEFDLGGNVNSLLATSDDLRSYSLREVMGGFVKKACLGEEIKIKSNFVCEYKFHKKNSLITQDIDQLLNDRNMPIVALEQMHLYSFSRGPEASFHALTVNARRWNPDKKRCEYRIRNSLDLLECGDYKSDVTCSSSEIKSGQVWVSKDLLERATGYLAVIK